MEIELFFHSVATRGDKGFERSHVMQNCKQLSYMIENAVP
jgi:hypothetical protein